MRKVSMIPEATYGMKHNGDVIYFEPSEADIQQALDEGQLESRGFQTDKDALAAEWNAGCKGDMHEFARLQKLYHARRIAYLVKHGWKGFPIEVMENGDMRDGTHRLKAAKFLGLAEVEGKRRPECLLTGR